MYLTGPYERLFRRYIISFAFANNYNYIQIQVLNRKTDAGTIFFIKKLNEAQATRGYILPFFPTWAIFC